MQPQERRALVFQVFTGFCPKGFGFGFGAVGLEFTVAVEGFALKHVRDVGYPRR